MEEVTKKMGGKRPGSGRKKTGRRRHPVSFSLSDEEEKYMRACLAKYRAEHPEPPAEEKKPASFYVTESQKKRLQDFLNKIREEED